MQDAQIKALEQQVDGSETESQLEDIVKEWATTDHNTLIGALDDYGDTRNGKTVTQALGDVIDAEALLPKLGDPAAPEAQEAFDEAAHTLALIVCDAFKAALPDAMSEGIQVVRDEWNRRNADDPEGRRADLGIKAMKEAA